MFKLFKDIIFGFRLKNAIKKADKFRHITHRKYMVIVIKGKFEVLSKQEVKKFLSHGIFKKGITMRDIEKKALYITM